MLRRLLTLVACLVLPVAAGLCWVNRPAAAAPTTAEKKPYGIGVPNFGQLSSASCAASGCHGGGEVGRKGSEHSTWSAEVDRNPDPHSGAYRVLFNDDSARMAKAVGGGPAHTNELCLKCHAVPDVHPNSAVSEGVGCGGCHGRAEGWLTAHVQPGWTAVPPRERWEKYGFAPTKNLVARTLICASCHVGDADREVNHDLIAAGHPRLAFETARFHHQPGYRKHWVELDPAGFEVRAWAVGQVASLRAAAELLRVRANRAVDVDGNTPWPEFAGQNCYACHHSLGDKPLSPGDGPLGMAAWEVWMTAAAEVAVRFTPDLYPGVRVPAWGHLPRLQAEMSRVNPDPKAVTKLAADTVTELDLWLAEVQAAEDAGVSALSADIARRIAHALATDAATDRDWDSLAVHFLGCAAMYHAAGGAKAVPGWGEPIRTLDDKLRFPKGYVSPKDFNDEKREQVWRQFAALKQATAEPGGER